MSEQDPSLESLQNGDEKAWADLHERHYPRMWNSVNRMLNNPSRTDDIVQEAFLKAYRTILHFRGESQIGTWLYRIAINQALDWLRKKKRRDKWISFFSPFSNHDEEISVPDYPVESQASSRLEMAEIRERILEAMKELSVDHRTVVQLRLIDELDITEVAQLLGIKQGTVNSRLHYACEHLRRKLKKNSKEI